MVARGIPMRRLISQSLMPAAIKRIASSRTCGGCMSAICREMCALLRAACVEFVPILRGSSGIRTGLPIPPMEYNPGDMKVGLVLGAGGVMGGAWLTGGLDALARETGWDPADADYVVGTSAGSMIGALCASGIPPWFMVAHSMGESFEEVVDAHGRPASEADRSAGAVFRVRHRPSIGPGSWRLALRSLSNPTRYPAATVFSGWLPKGMVSTEPLKEQVRRVVPAGWSPHPNLWIVACDY